jgi:hypothetical protein
MNAQFTAKTNCGVHTAQISMNKSTTPKPATCNNLTRRCFTQALTCNIFMRGETFQGEAQTCRWPAYGDLHVTLTRIVITETCFTFTTVPHFTFSVQSSEASDMSRSCIA